MTAYLLTEQQHAQIVADLQFLVDRFEPVRSELIFSKRLALDKTDRALAMLKAMKPLEPTAYSITHKGMHCGNLCKTKEHATLEKATLDNFYTDGAREAVPLYAPEDTE